MAHRAANHTDRIVKDPKILLGKPVIKGTRIPAELVLEHLAATPDLEDLFAAYPELTVEDVKAVLAYARAAIAHRRQGATDARATRA